VKIPNLGLDASTVKTNIVIFDCQRTGLNAVEFCEALAPRGILALDTALYSVRFVTHCDVDRAGCERAVEVVREVASKTRRAAV
jgi:threonine aldolase